MIIFFNTVTLWSYNLNYCSLHLIVDCNFWMILWFLIGFSFNFFPSSFSSFLPPFLLLFLISTKPSWLFHPILLLHLLSFLLAPDSNDIYFLNARIAFFRNYSWSRQSCRNWQPCPTASRPRRLQRGGESWILCWLEVVNFYFLPLFSPYSHFL